MQLAAVLLAAVAVLAVIGSVLPFSSLLTTIGGASSVRTESYTRTITGWTVGYDGNELVARLNGAGESPPLIGIPLVLAAVLGIVGSVLLLQSSRRPQPSAVPAVLAVITAGLVVGTVAPACANLVATALSQTAARRRDPAAALGFTTDAEVGSWFLLAAALFAVAVTGLLVVGGARFFRPAPVRAAWPAAVLLVVIAVLTTVGSIAVLSSATAVARDPAAGPPRVVLDRSSWVYTDPTTGENGSAPLFGIPLVIAAALAVLAAVLLLRSGGRPGGRVPARLLGAAAAAGAVGTVAGIWLDLLSRATNVAVTNTLLAGTTTGAKAPVQGLVLGTGSWLLLVAGVLALVVLGPLLASGRERAPI